MAQSNDIKDFDHVDLLYPNDYLKSGGITEAGGVLILTVSAVEPRHELKNDRGKENKPILRFIETKKMMVLNKTNAKRIAKLYGPKPTGWVGKQIALGVESVQAFGDIVDAIRVKQEKPAGPTPLAKALAAIKSAKSKEDLTAAGNDIQALGLTGGDRDKAIDAFKARSEELK